MQIVRNCLVEFNFLNELSEINFFLKFLRFMFPFGSIVVAFNSLRVVSDSFVVVGGFTVVIVWKIEWHERIVI